MELAHGSPALPSAASGSPDLAIRPLSFDEIGLALDWAAAEGWNPGLHDGLPFCSADSGGFLAGFVEKIPIALISAVRYGADHGFIGFYIVKPEWRGLGHGRALWQAARHRLSGRNVGLDGVLAQQDNYRRSGFQLAWRNIRYQGSAAAGGMAAVLPSGQRIVPLSALPFEMLDRYDRAFFPAERSAFLKSWIAQPQTMACGFLSDQQLAGYGVLRPCRTGYKIGPLFADTAAIAEALFNALCREVASGIPVFLDVPECHREAVLLAGRHGMQAMFETARMYTGAVPDISLLRTYGITSFELG